MSEKLKNIIENIAIDFLNNALATRFDICTCDKCRNEMLAFILSRVPAQYVTSDSAALKSIIDQTRVEKVAEIARVLLEAIKQVSNNPPHALDTDKNQAFDLLLKKIYDDRGVDFRHYHKELLKRRVAIRMRENKVSSFSDYLMLIIKKPEEYDKLFAVLCINVSEFFRDADVWEAVKPIAKKIILEKEAKKEKKLVVWSSACATGEEPYSLAILFKELLKFETCPFTFELYASDIDPKALKACQKAEYQKPSLRNVKEEYLKRYFTQVQPDTWKVNDDIKAMVNFKQLDLISAEYIKNTDLIFCRNVFIYFSRSLQDQLLMKYYRSLNDGGYLVMGKSETMWPEANHIFREVSLAERIYSKIPLSSTQ